MNRHALIAIAGAGSALLLGGAFIFQALGYPPCAMCLWQRWPHVAAIALAAIAYFVPYTLLLVAGLGAALTTAAIGIYHTGVERGFWEGPSSCTSSSVTGISADDLLDQIMAAPLVRCDEVPWELFSLSMASWNAVISLALAAIWITAARLRS